MRGFANLLMRSGQPGEIQEGAAAQFQSVVQRAGWKNWDGHDLPAGEWVIIGVASYSLQDMQLLDDVKTGESLHLIDLVTLPDMAAVKLGFRTEREILQSPVIMRGHGPRVIVAVVDGHAATQEIRRLGVAR